MAGRPRSRSGRRWNATTRQSSYGRPSSRILLRPSGLDRNHFYRGLLGLASYREFGSPDDRGLVFFLGQGLLEVFGHAAGPPGHSVVIWIQVRDVHAEHAGWPQLGFR
jgi:hypothetical protein